MSTCPYTQCVIGCLLIPMNSIRIHIPIQIWLVFVCVHTYNHRNIDIPYMSIPISQCPLTHAHCPVQLPPAPTASWPLLHAIAPVPFPRCQFVLYWDALCMCIDVYPYVHHMIYVYIYIYMYIFVIVFKPPCFIGSTTQQILGHDRFVRTQWLKARNQRGRGYRGMGTW